LGAVYKTSKTLRRHNNIIKDNDKCKKTVDKHEKTRNIIRQPIQVPEKNVTAEPANSFIIDSTTVSQSNLTQKTS
jgi:hypothetical protein